MEEIELTLPGETAAAAAVEVTTSDNGAAPPGVAGEAPPAAAGSPAPASPPAAPVLAPDGLFNDPVDVLERLKLFLWGGYGEGKSYLACQFPDVVAIDLENGLRHYLKRFGVRTFKNITSIARFETAVRWLTMNRHDYRTLLIDPVTLLWEMLQNEYIAIFMKRDQESSGFKGEFFELGPKHWAIIKRHWKRLMTMLMELDMNVIVTARSKDEYSSGAGEFMQKTGAQTFDSEKGVPYWFDVVVEVMRDGDKFSAICRKDRTGKMPLNQPFASTYEFYRERFGPDMERATTPVEPATDQQLAQIRGRVAEFAMSAEQLAERLPDYGAGSLEDLTRENADLMLQRFEAAAAKRDAAVQQAEAAGAAAENETTAAAQNEQTTQEVGDAQDQG